MNSAQEEMTRASTEAGQKKADRDARRRELFAWLGTEKIPLEAAQEEIVRAFAMWERAQLYDWCLCGGGYSLVAYAEKMTPLFLESFRVRE